MLSSPTTNSSASFSMKNISLGGSNSRPSEYYTRLKGRRQSRGDPAEISLHSGSSSRYTSDDTQSAVSSITMDYFDEDTTVTSGSDTRSYQHHYRMNRNKLGTMPESEASVEEYPMKFHHSISDNTNRFSSAETEDKHLCAMPRRRSSASRSLIFHMKQLNMNDEDSSSLDHDPAADTTIRCQETTEFTELTDGCSMRSLQGSLDETDPFQVGLYGDDDDNDGENDNQYDQPPMPDQKPHFFDSCTSLEGSANLFDDSFQVGLQESDEEDCDNFNFGVGNLNNSDTTQKTSNTRQHDRFRPMQGRRQSNDSSMAAIRSTDFGSEMFDSCQLGLLEEEEEEEDLDLHDHDYQSNTDPGSKSERSDKSDIMGQSLRLEDIFEA